MTDDEFNGIQRKMHDATSDIFDAYISAGRGPRDATVDAFSDLLDCSPNEFRKFFARYARSKGSNLFFAHYPEFGEEGCEFERPISN